MSKQSIDIRQWLIEQLPTKVVSIPPELERDEEDLQVILNLSTEGLQGEGETRKQAELALIEQARRETRQLRVQLARRLQHTTGLVISWGMRAGDSVQLFTNNNTAPVMTRLSHDERKVLDTLIAANVANTRSTALAYIVRSFAHDHAQWLEKVHTLSKQMANLSEELRQSKPASTDVAPQTE